MSLLPGTEQIMKIDDAAILKRAKELCARGGANWDWAGRSSSNKPTLDQAGRRKFLTLAREQLLIEQLLEDIRPARALEPPAPELSAP